MPVFRGDPLLAELQSMGDDMDRAFGRLLANQGQSARGWLPAADIYETDDEVVIDLDVPGCHSENLSVEAVDGQLVISGERHPTDKVTRRYRSERWSGKFVRSFTLQSNVRGDDVRADYQDGVLTVHIPKPEETKPKRISITRERKQITKSN
ncbi:MAG TPA: Hsp20/alpha crystallin family protein [Gaiellales bacterium]|jgi:HSP20 family protein|nr:Hsp20/alpha crystallin family protein [Gaiellales bacterium]